MKKAVGLLSVLFSIPDFTFTICPNLRYVTIPESVVLIQPYAFDFETITIGCKYDSYAYHYAKENGFLYELLDGVMLGDANGDKFIDISDVTYIQRHVAELENLSGIYFKAADVDGNGVVNVSDATTIQMFIADYDVQYPIGKVMTQ